MADTVAQVTTIDRDELLRSAKDFADRALKAYTEDDRRVILQHAATSAEHLSKAYLASLDPVLLMELKNGQLDSLLHLAGLPQKVKKADYPRTIGSREAVSRVRHVLPGLKAPATELDDLINVRNGVIHVGFLAETNTREILTAYLRFANELFDELGVPAEERWGPHTELVNFLISRSLTEIEHEVQRKIAAARGFFADLVRKIPADELEPVAAARQADRPRMLPGETYSEKVECPACGDFYAKALGVIDHEYDSDVVMDEGGFASVVYSAAPVHTLHARRILCGVCTLHLDNPDELKAAGVDTSWIVEDYFEEPDFDACGDSR